MNERYNFFRQLMDILADDCEIIDARMYNWDNAVEIKGLCGDTEVTVTAKFKEVQKDGN